MSGVQDVNSELSFAFGDFTQDELNMLSLEEPVKPKSWAAAVGSHPVKDVRAPVWGTNTKEKIIPTAFEDAIQIALIQLDVTVPAKEMKKRGLLNQGNTCFQNAIMQSMLSCPPFLNLLVSISSLVGSTHDLLSHTTSFCVWRHVIAFVREFEEPRLGQVETKQNQAIRITGYFMDLLTEFQQIRGEQEDALEFLEFLLDRLHIEYEQSQLIFPMESNSQDMDQGWAEVQGKKSALLHSNPVDRVRSPINWLFKGTIRTELTYSGKQPRSITIEPFHCLHLHLDNISCRVEDMIRKSFAMETIQDGYHTIKRTTRIDTLPIVLTLNIKRFTYHMERGPVKLQQFVHYPMHFTFPIDLVSSPTYYQLFAVVSHHGQSIIGGHYTSVCRDNKDQWFQYNDEHVISITQTMALQEQAFLLFYIRTTIPPPVLKKNEKEKRKHTNRREHK